MRDGELVAAAEEERFRRIKHWAVLPSEAVRHCRAEAGISLAEVGRVAINRNSKANLFKKALYAVARCPSFDLVRARLENASRVLDPITLLAQEFGVLLRGSRRREGKSGFA